MLWNTYEMASYRTRSSFQNTDYHLGCMSVPPFFITTCQIFDFDTDSLLRCPDFIDFICKYIHMYCVLKYDLHQIYFEHFE